MGIIQKNHEHFERVLSDYGVSEADNISTIIDDGLTIEGAVQAGNGRGIAVFGVAKGLIECDGVVFVAPGAKALGGIRAHVIIAAGEVSGEEVLARACLQVKTKGLVKSARIAYGELEHERGGRIEGGLSPVEIDEAVRKWDEARVKAASGPKAAASVTPIAQTVSVRPAAPAVTPAPEFSSRTEAAAAAMARPLPAVN
jgi:cytoskeletal protein CcmA (bactofilin family)